MISSLIYGSYGYGITKVMEVMVDTQAMDMAREKLKLGSEAMYMKRERLKQKLWLWRLYRVSQKNAPVACCHSELLEHFFGTPCRIQKLGLLRLWIDWELAAM